MDSPMSRGWASERRESISRGNNLYGKRRYRNVWIFMMMIAGAVHMTATFAMAASQSTELRSQSVKECTNAKTESDLDDCYVSALKRFRGHPQDLVRRDVRDALAYCDLAGESNDAAFCGDLINRHSRLHAQLMRERIENSRQRTQRRAEEEAKKPKAEPVVAKSVGVIPGAIVCPDYRRVSIMISWYNAHWSDTLEDKITKGQSRLMRGAPTRNPDFERYGCALIAPGTPMMVELGNMVPVVQGKLSNGKIFRGVTDHSMLQR